MKHPFIFPVPIPGSSGMPYICGQTSENNFHSATYDNSEFLFRRLDQLKKELCQRCWIGLRKRIMEFLKYMILPATYVPY